MSEPAQKTKLTFVRWIFAVLGILIMIFAGGCAVLYSGFMLPVTLAAGGEQTLYVVFITLLFGGIPFGIGFLIWRLAVKFRRT